MEELLIEHRVPITKIKSIDKHPNADRLELATVFGFQVVVGKGQYQAGDSVIYVPMDSIIPTELEAKLFGPDSKIKLSKSRVRQIRIRGAVSQGMLVEIRDTNLSIDDCEEDKNVGELLGITKYEPPTPQYASSLYKGPQLRNRPKENPYFHKYAGIQNFKWYPDLFTEGQEVVIQEKIHGTHLRFGMLPYIPTTLWDKVRKLLRILPEFQFTYGSNNVQLQKRNGHKGYYEEDIYGKACKKYDVQNKLNPHETVYCELYGPGIQKNYSYGLKDGEHAIAVFDIKVLAPDRKSTRWLTSDEVKEWCKQRDLPMVPELYRGPFSQSVAKFHTEGVTQVGGTDIKEGVVIRDPVETSSYMGKKWLKLISEDYLSDESNTDNH